MNGCIKTYDFFAKHKGGLLALSVIVMGVLSFFALRLEYQEDIFDFLPTDDDYTESMQVYSSISEASRIVVIFEAENTDSIVNAIDAFAEAYPDAVTEVDMDALLRRMDFIYLHLPYFLTDESYRVLEAVCDPDNDTLRTLLEQDKQVLSMPGTAFLRPALTADPLHLVPVERALSGQYAGAQTAFMSYEGYMTTTDGRMGFAFVDSPFGSTETAQNTLLLDSITAITSSVQDDFPSVSIRLLGAPVIAVGNAQRIKKDSMGAITLSVLLILALLLYAFPRKRDILLIFTAIGFGWLVGMATLAICVGHVSIIVLGIGAVLIGIGVNYPLHLLVHQRYTSSVRQTLQEVSSPLIKGNITTVAAFLALIPLHSPALRQLGIFAAAMFVGTIAFCIVVLPHLMSDKAAPVREIHLPFLEKWLHTLVTRYRRGLTLMFIGLFVVLGGLICLRQQSMFDPNLHHINYMTEAQQRDFAWFEKLSPVSDEQAFLADSARNELHRRISRWNTFWNNHSADSLTRRLEEEANILAFRPDVFLPFIHTLQNDPQVLDLTNTATLAQLWPGRFDTQAMNERVTQSLTEHFDYIGLVCSLIVGLFLCISFRSVVIGIIAFLPMLLSWVLIIAFMQLFGLQFNIVNIILATFIFGQGDDYTIFVVEGLLYERKHGKPMLNQYKQSVLLSAAVMLLTMGVLVFAQHPAMASLGAVTLIGMTCVVAMAFIVPPLLFRLLSPYHSRTTPLP